MEKWLQDAIEGHLKAIYKWLIAHGPAWVAPTGKLLGYLFLLLAAIYLFLETALKVRKVLEEVLPRLSESERIRHTHRQRFSSAIRDQLRDLNKTVQWSDEGFTDLEAEVEAEGRERFSSVLAWLLRQRVGVRRERSLTRAIKRSRERILILEGPAGSGKTVALRHVVLQLADEAAHSYSNRHPIGIYINLKTLSRGPAQEIDATLLESHVRRSVNELNDSAMEAFLADELNRGREEGSLIFFLDSFDEIPEILNAADANDTIRAYGRAIDAFVGRMGRARAIVAARPFRGPKRLGWPIFRILPLTHERQKNFIRLSRLPQDVEAQLDGELPNARLELQTVAENPLFLRLLCEYVRIRRSFPNNVFEIFETFVENRFASDATRIRHAFSADPKELRNFAEEVAFLMNHTSAMGLSPPMDELNRVLAESLGIDAAEAASKFQALVALGFATMSEESGSTRFSFGHRRLQEYFATAVVLREPDRIPPDSLLTDGVWRETAVTVLQTQPSDRVTPVLEQATLLLGQMAASIPPPVAASVEWFPWPDGSLHLLGVLQDAAISRPSLFPAHLSENAERIITDATNRGTILDQKWAVESAGAVSRTTLENLIRHSMTSPVEILRDAAYRQAARLVQLPSGIVMFVRTLLIRMALSRSLAKNRAATYTHLRRLPDGEAYIELARLLRLAIGLDSLMACWAAIPVVLSTLVILQSSVGQHIDRSRTLLVVGALVAWGIVLTALFRVPQSEVDSQFATALKKRLRWRYAISAAAALSVLLVFGLYLKTNIAWSLLAWFALGCLPALYAYISIVYAPWATITAPWYLLPVRWIWQSLRIGVPQVVRSTRSGVTKAPSYLFSKVTTVLVYLVGIVSFYLVLFLGLFLCDLISTKVPRVASTVTFAATTVKTTVIVICGVVLLCLVVVLLLILVATTYIRIREWLLLATMARKRRITPTDFLSIVMRLSVSSNRLKFFRSVRRDAKLEPGREEYAITAALLLIAQGGDPHGTYWFEELSQKDLLGKLSGFKLSPASISELARLVEQVRPGDRY